LESASGGGGGRAGEGSLRFADGKPGLTAGCAMAVAAKAAALRKSSARRPGFIRFEASLCQPAKAGKKGGNILDPNLNLTLNLNLNRKEIRIRIKIKIKNLKRRLVRPALRAG
jgi:hypothetical protein